MILMSGKHTVLTTDRTRWDILTPERRKAIYGLAAAFGAILIAFGGAAPESVQQWLDIVDKILAIAVPLLAALHTGGVYSAPSYGEQHEN